MKNKLKLIGLIAIMIAAAFSFAACDLLGEEDKGCGCCSDCSDTCQGDCCSNCKKGNEQGNNKEPDNKDVDNITITVTGNFSEFNGKKAAMLVYTGSDPVAWANFIDVAPGATSLTFTILDYVTDESFNTTGTYNVLLWFREGTDKASDVNYFKMNQAIKLGTNTIQFSTFPLLSDDDDPSELPTELFGTWIKEDDDTMMWVITEETFTMEYTLYQPVETELFYIVSYEDGTVTLRYDFDEDDENLITFNANISNGKLVISGSPDGGFYDGTYINENDYIYGDSDWLAIDWEEYGISGGLKQPKKTTTESVETVDNNFIIKLSSNDVSAIVDAFYNLNSQMNSKDGWESGSYYTSQYGGYGSYINDIGTLIVEFTYYSDYDEEEDTFTEPCIKIEIGPYEG